MLGVSSVVLRAAGCSLPKPPAELTSLWSFDETSQAGGVFGNLGPAGVPMAMVGTWTDLTTASMVQTVGGTSAYTGGSGYATIAADDPAHALSALTISFYYQRNSATAKQILLAAGDGSQAGDFSIEVLADGKLRGYHVGQDSVLRFFEDGSGIAGTNLQVGTAHRIDLTLGPQGARIYLDGAELAAAAIFAHRNSWNNARTKYLGRWTDGVQGPADGAFDRFRIWNQQLTNAEIDLLEPAQSIEIGGAPPAGDELSVPSLAEWLTNDDTAVPSSNVVHVYRTNRGTGSGSDAANAKELQAALDAWTSGQTLVAICLDPNGIEFYDCPNGLTFPNGNSASDRVTLMAEPDKGVVISACEDFAGARTPNSGFWTQSGLSQADIDKKIWRSTDTFSGGSEQMMGFWVEFDHPHQLLRYGSLTNLRAAYGTADSPTNYATPGVHKDTDNRVYIRFQRPHPGKYSAGGTWSSNLWPGHPEAVNGSGEIVYPVSEDPNDYVIHLFRATSPSSGPRAFGSTSSVSGQYKQIGPGINSVGFTGTTIGRHGKMVRGTHLSWRQGILPGHSTTQEDWFFDRCRFSSGFKFCRAEWKFGGWLENIRDAALLGGASNGHADLYFRDCTIADFHEIMTSHIATTQRNFRWRNCVFYNILDDGFQVHQGMGRVEIGYCWFINSAVGGGGSGGSEQNGDLWYIHHCIYDGRTECGSDWRGQPHPHFMHMSHSPDHDQPRKCYNNTVMWGPDSEQQTGAFYTANYLNMMKMTGAANAHEAFNNLVCRHGLKRYDTTTYSNSGVTAQSDYLIRYVNCDADLSNEFFDYNLYYKDVPSPTVPSPSPLEGWGRDIRDGANGSGGSSFASLSAFRASALFTLSKAAGNLRGAYTPGFEGNSTDSKPTMPSLDNYPTARFQYRPSATSAVTVATSVSLSGADWWSGDGPSWGGDYFPWDDLAPDAWKGALDPNGSTITVGVQNP